MDRILGNPWVTRAGNGAFLGGIVLTLYRLLIAGKDPLWAVTLPLLILGIILMLAPQIRKVLIRRPIIALSSGSGFEYERNLAPSSRSLSLKTDDEAVYEYGIAFKVSETSGRLWARNLRTRIISTNPVPTPGQGSLPVPLSWDLPGNPASVDLPPGGREYVQLVTMTIFLKEETGDSRVMLSMPFPHLQLSASVDLVIEAYDDEGTLARQEFRYLRPPVDAQGKVDPSSRPTLVQLTQ